MLVSPSIASSNLLNISEEIEFVDKYFDNIHLDIADGVAVGEISFGMKLCKMICDKSKSKCKSIHLEVFKPLNYIEAIKKCNANIVFLQTDFVDNPIEIIEEYKKNGIPTGANLSNLDFGKDYLDKVIELSDEILVNTTYHSDPEQIVKLEMLEFAKELSKTKKVYIDGGINIDMYKKLNDSNIYCAVMGRAVFQNKEIISNWYSLQ